MVHNFKTIVSYLSLIFIISTAEENCDHLGYLKNHSILTTDFSLYLVVCAVMWKKTLRKTTPQHNLICSLYESHSINTCLSLYRIFWYCPFQTWLLLFLSSKPPPVRWHIGLTLYHSAGKPLSPKPEMEIKHWGSSDPPKPQTSSKCVLDHWTWFPL